MRLKSIPPVTVLPLLKGGTASLVSLFRKHQPEAGSRPGTLVIPEGAEPPRISVVEYDADTIEERDAPDLEALAAPVPSGRKRWVDVQGLGDEGVLRSLARIYGLHPLLLEDVVNAPQPPKSEAYEGHHFLITRMFRSPDGVGVESEQVSIVLSAGTVITFQERVGDVLDPVRRRLREGTGPMRRSGSDYLAYALLDTVVDHYHSVLEMLGRRLEDLEEGVMVRADQSTMHAMLRVKADLLGFRRALRPQRDALTQLLRDGSPLVQPTVLPYFRDTLDHASHAVETVDNYRELVTSLMNTYLSAVANRTNEVMKVLTIMASIFIPLTFVAGIYGMNFEFMPELRTRWGYPVVLLIMAATASGMLLYFRRRGWIGSADRDDEER